MRTRWLILSLCLLCLAGAWFFWHQPANTRTRPSALQKVAVPSAFAPLRRDKTVRPHPPSTAPNILATASTNAATSAKTNQFAYRLSNTTKTIGQLVGDRHAILLENALIDTGAKLNFSIPKNLQSPGDPGAYIVQARGPIDNAFRAMLAAAGAEIVSYIPNNAYLVRAQAGVANGLAGNPLTQGVIPYEPYYKIQSSMLTLAVGQMALPDGAALNLGLFGDNAQQTIQEIEKLGGKILARGSSPFGPVVRVQPSQNWTALATLPGVQIVEPYHPRGRANDLSRVATGVSIDTLVPTNYMNLNGFNVMVEVNDFGIDATHPDLIGRVLGSPTTDTSGHGTHVAGIIAGDGTKSDTVTDASGSIVPGTIGQFRGKAQLAKLLSMDVGISSDQELQAAAARTDALISNNSWYYEGDANYDLAAASYDAAVRDALPEMIGSQPVLFVFAAGNNGGGDDSNDPGGGNPDTIFSPATAKNVITVGALQEFRNITNVVTTISADGVTNTGTPWQPETSTSYRMAGFSSRGNVGIGIEGTYGRYKPDVVAPGTFVLSTRSEQWDVASYFYINPTNHDFNGFSGLVLQPGGFWANVFPIVPNNAVQAAIYVYPNADSPVPFPDLTIYFGLASAAAYTYNTVNNQVLIPPDGGLTIANILNTESFYGFNYAVSNNTAQPISFDVVTDVVTTNNPGDYFLVLSNLNQSIGTFNPGNSSPGPYYRYESGTSMSAAGVSGVLALMQDYFTNTLHATPSPALLKAMVINGARATGFYNFHPQNAINYEGWGLINLPNSLPIGVTTNLAAGGESMLMIDQNPTTALATGDSHRYQVTIVNTNALALPLRITLAWTDPPGDPAAAIKLVNDLNLVVSNSDAGVVYYGNDIPASSTFNSAQNSTNAPNYDAINNVENVYLQPGSGTNFSVTVLGYRVNVNAVTAQSNNVVQDFALVISSGNGEAMNAFTVTDIGPGLGIVSNPTTDQQITFVTSTNKPLLNQLVGASTPLLGTNTIPLGTNLVWGGTNSIVTLGMTNQWHFYVVTNTTGFTNVAFITFIPNTLSIPRMGVFADSAGNATRPEADIDLYVTTDPTLMNLNPVAISNCVNGAQVGASSGNIFNGASLGRGGTEFVVDTNSSPSIPGEVYYVGVYSEDQEASEYGFIPIFSERPFSQMNPNGSQSVFGVPMPVDIPDGTPARPGHGYIFGLALYPMQVLQVVVTNTIVHQNFGDLIGTLDHGGQNGLSQTVVLNNHDSLGNPPGPYTQIYDDSGQNNIFGSQPSDGPGSLNSFVGNQGNGVWLLTETDDSLTQTGSAIGFNTLIEPHHPLDKGITTILGPLGWFYDYIDVPPGATNLTIYATNLTGTGQVDLFVKVGARPTLTATNEIGPAMLTNSGPLGFGNSISIGPPLVPGRYWVGLYNESLVPQTVYIVAKLGMGTAPQATFTSAGPAPILDDAVMTNSIFVTAAQILSSVEVALRVDHQRVSDLVFHLISPEGTRCLLVENRGGTTTNGMGATLAFTNITPASSSGNGLPSTNVIDTGLTAGSVQISYNFYTVPDEMVVQYQGTNIFDSGIVNGSGVFTIAYGPGASTQLTVIMNPIVYAGDGDLWDYTVNSSQAYYTYLVLTEDTNKTTTPIKYAVPPFRGTPTLTPVTNVVVTTIMVPVTNAVVVTNTWVVTNMVVTTNGFEGATAGDYTPASGPFDSWTVNSNQVTVITDTNLAYRGSNLLALADGTISRLLPTTPGQTCTLTYAYRGPGAVGMWRGEGNPNDSIYGNNGSVQNISYAAGEVGQTFVFNPSFISRVSVPDQPIYQLTNSLSIEGWIKPVGPGSIILWRGDQRAGFDPYFLQMNGDNTIGFIIEDATGVGQAAINATLAYNQWWHVAATLDGNKGTMNIYTNGVLAARTNTTIRPLSLLIPAQEPTIGIGNVGTHGFFSIPFNGDIDEISLYSRALSASEVQAIFQKGSLGKFDPAGTLPQSLAEAQMTVGVTPFSPFFGNNTNWQTTTITFPATQTNTPLRITGIEPGMLLDNFVLTNFVVLTNTTYWTNYATNGFEGAAAGDYTQSGSFFDGWAENTNQVTVITDTNLAYRGSNLLALADGQISRILPTVPGQTYTLTYAYRGPGAVSLWRGETNANDSVDGNNGSLVNGTSFAAGEVNQAFSFNGTSGYVSIPDSPSMDSFTKSITIDSWLKVNQLTANADWKGIVTKGNSSWRLQATTFAKTVDWAMTGVTPLELTGTRNVNDGQWHHVAAIYDGTKMSLYVDGTLDVSQPATGLIAQNSFPVCLGNNVQPPSGHTYFLNGLVDEASIYNRPLSASEVQAIYNHGFMGKYDLAAPSIAQGLAEARVTVGGTNLLFFGNNTNWQTTNITFTAALSNTVLQITGFEPGMLLDNFALTRLVVVTNNVVTTNASGGDVYYLPEQSLDIYKGLNALGQWQLEIWDNRAGAGLTNTLVSWQLRFNFATNFNSIGVLTNGLAVTNVIPPGGMAYYLVIVPPNADIATNILFSTNGLPLTGPLNVWFNPTTLPTGTNPPDYVLITNSTGGSSILGLNTNPTNIVPGGTYYLGVQNMGTASVTYGIVVNFHLLFPPAPPPIGTQVVDELTLMTVTNTASSAHLPLTYTLTSTVVFAVNSAAVSDPNVPVIDANGIITWTPDEVQGPGYYFIQTIITDSSVPPLSTTNSFYVRVIEVNTAPFFLATNPPDQTINALYTLIVTNAAGDSDIPTNPLTYTLLNPPAGMTIDNNGAITWTPTLAQALTSNLITTVVTDFNVWAPVNQILSATNYFTVFVTGALSPFAFTQPATSVTGTSARLNGMATPNGPPTTAWFEWGTSATYGNQTPPVSVGGSFNVVYVPSQINGLVMNQPYHFRLVVSNLLGVVYGFDQIFDETGVVAWGADYVGQTDVPPGLSNMVAVAGAYDHSLALKNDGTVVAWGDNTKEQTNVPAGLNGVVAVTGGEYYSLALKNDGTVVSWGGSILGQTNVPSGLNGVVNIAGGTFSSLALKSNGRVVAWGASFFGLTNVPSGLSNIVAVAGGGYHSLAVKNDGTVLVWGDNSAGQKNVPPGLSNVVAIAGGSFHSLALKYDGTVVAWGDNSAGQTNVPAGLNNVVAVAAGGFHSLVLKNDGSVLAWGDNTTGQTNIPASLSNVVAITSGYFHNLALASPFNVNLTNTPPFWLTTNLPPQTLDELTLLTVTNTANDSDLPPQTLTYTVTMLVDTNAMITNGWPLNYATTNPPPVVNSNGVITWTPSEAQGPGVYIITAVVTDNGAPPLSATNSFTVTVNEVNTPPFWPANVPSQTNYIINALSTLTVMNTATDTDIPPNPLTYQLSGPTGATIDTDGVITWTPTLAQAGTTNIFTTVVTDTNPPAVNATSLSATNSFTVTVTTLINLPGGQPQTNSVGAGGIIYYVVNVPTNADFATNILLFATNGPVNVWFDTNFPPTPNLLLLPDGTYPSGTNGSVVLSASTTPPLVPGSTYYLGVQNTNSFAVTYAIEVDFHLLTSTNAPAGPIVISSITATNIGGTNGFLLQWQGPANFQYEIQWTTNLAPPVWNTVLNPVINVVVTATNGHFSFFDDGTLTGGFGPMKFYRVLGSLNLGPITGSGPATNTVLAGAMSQAVVTVPANAISASNILISATSPLNVWFNQTNPPTGNTSAGDFLILSATSAGAFVLTSNSVPPLVPGTNYYLGFQNPGASNVTFVFQVIFGYPPVSISSVSVLTNGNFQLQWSAPTNYQFQVAWTTNLAPPVVWNYIPPSPPYITSITTNFTFVDTNAPTAMKFYRLVEYP
jgi:subtilisin-like proprotein convertase family protein